jgi:hypothetical protein
LECPDGSIQLYISWLPIPIQVVFQNHCFPRLIPFSVLLSSPLVSSSPIRPHRHDPFGPVTKNASSVFALACILFSHSPLLTSPIHHGLFLYAYYPASRSFRGRLIKKSQLFTVSVGLRIRRSVAILKTSRRFSFIYFYLFSGGDKAEPLARYQKAQNRCHGHVTSEHSRVVNQWSLLPGLLVLDDILGIRFLGPLDSSLPSPDCPLCEPLDLQVQAHTE